ncbi:REST corepressor 3 [Galendromus occidentalis]|uniref:REST corepressor 3 n=1 Tax=Galendromus occidentalis TaxID=34638 RepID=A0AAJ6QYR1_9ACAR|nr:REST corepressor 3 [Galendromus occidentalis]
MSRQPRRDPTEGAVKEASIRIGPQYQAEVPPLRADPISSEHKADLLYTPASTDEDESSKLIKKQLGNPHTKWTLEEKVNFKKCLSRHKKKFNRYKDLIPNKTIVQLLDHYYATKIREPPEPSHFDPDYNPGRTVKKGRPRKPTTDVKLLFRRKCSGPGVQRLRFGVDEIRTVIHEDHKPKVTVEKLRNQSAQLKSEISRTRDDKQIEQYKKLCTSNKRSTQVTAWTDSELIMAVHAIRLHGKDFKAVSKLMGSKTEAQVKVFYSNYRERYNLEGMVRLFEEDRKNGVARKMSNVDQPRSVENSPVKKLIRSPLKKPSILLRRKV